MKLFNFHSKFVCSVQFNQVQPYCDSFYFYSSFCPKNVLVTSSPYFFSTILRVLSPRDLPTSQTPFPSPYNASVVASKVAPPIFLIFLRVSLSPLSIFSLIYLTYLEVASTIGSKTADKNPALMLTVLVVVSLIFQNFSFVSYETSTFLVLDILEPMYSPALLTPVAAAFPSQTKPFLRISPPFLIQ